jgi:uncharacterized protein YbjQ (UPF0145 family)
MSLAVLLSTTSALFGYNIVEHVGLVCGSSVTTQNALRSWTDEWRNVFGRQLRRLAKKGLDALESAQTDLKQHAHELNANAVVGITVTSYGLGPEGVGAAFVVCGTAVKARKVTAVEFERVPVKVQL